MFFVLQLKEIRKKNFTVESLLQTDAAGAGNYHIVVKIKSNESLTQLEQDVQTALTNRSLVAAEYANKKKLLEPKLLEEKNYEKSLALLEKEYSETKIEMSLLEEKISYLKIGMDELQKNISEKKNF